MKPMKAWGIPYVPQWGNLVVKIKIHLKGLIVFSTHQRVVIMSALEQWCFLVQYCLWLIGKNLVVEIGVVPFQDDDLGMRLELHLGMRPVPVHVLCPLPCVPPPASASSVEYDHDSQRLFVGLGNGSIHVS